MANTERRNRVNENTPFYLTEINGIILGNLEFLRK